MPAVADKPKELTEDWIKTLEKVKARDCNPAGMPATKISLISFQDILKIFDKRNLMTVFFLLVKNRTVNKAWQNSQMTVARPTPATSISKTATKRIFNPILTTAQQRRTYRGLLESPMERKMADPKLKIIKKGVPKK